jgi:hypothetical protein
LLGTAPFGEIVVDQIKPLITSRKRVEADKLADPDVTYRSL